jgi:CubicO group peptidase (beta-lactamase class C family)
MVVGLEQANRFAKCYGAVKIAACHTKTDRLPYFRCKYFYMKYLQPVFSLTVAIMVLPACHVVRAYKFRHLSLKDHERIPSVAIAKGDMASPFTNLPDTAQYSLLRQRLTTSLTNSYTAAFMVIRNDTILYEHYFDGFDQRSLLPSFSVAKSFVGTLVGIALDEGKINSLQDPITRYLPQLLQRDKRYAAITLQHLLDMRSGLQWNEGSYGLKDDAIKMGFRPNMYPYILKVKVAKDPGGAFNYQSINTQLLAMAVEKATGQSIGQYMQQKLWQPMGMESRATWNTDKKKRVIAYGTLNATARDFAKLGRLYLNEGKHNGQQLVSAAWVRNTVSADSMQRKGMYHNQWWASGRYKVFADSAKAVAYLRAQPFNSAVKSYTMRDGTKQYFITLPDIAYFAEGILEQFVYVVPSKKLILVRLGHNWRHPSFGHAESFLQTLGEEL